MPLAINLSDHPRLPGVLVVAYGYPPTGGPGALRVSKYTQYLSDHGWRAIVLTVKDGYNPVKPLPVPQNRILRIERVAEVDPVKKLVKKSEGGLVENGLTGRSRRISWVKQLYRSIAFPDRDWFWLPGAVYAGSKLLQDPALDISMIFSSSPNITNHAIAMLLKRRSGLSWVAEFRDYWAFSDTRPPRNKTRAKLERELEQRICNQADCVISVSQECCQGFIDEYGLSPSRVMVIHNGFDPSDFAHVVSTNAYPKFSLAHAGFFYEGVCDPTPFFRALRMLQDNGDIDLGKTALDFYGHYDPVVDSKLQDLDLSSIANWHGYVPYRDLISRLCNTYVLLSVAPGEGYVNTKIFDYMGCRRPIIASGFKGSTLDSIITNAGIGFVVDPHDEEGMKLAILHYWRCWKNGELGWSQASAQVLEPYTRPYQAGQLAVILDRLMPKRET